MALAAAIFLAVLGEAAGSARLVEVVNERRRIVQHGDGSSPGAVRASSAPRRHPRPRASRVWLLAAAGRSRGHARVALAELGDARAKQVILRGLSAWSRDARTLAAAAAAAHAYRGARAAGADARRPSGAEAGGVSDALALIDGRRARTRLDVSAPAASSSTAHLRIRLLDERMVQLPRQGRIGFTGSLYGARSGARRRGMALRPSDWIFPALRESYVMLQRGFSLARYVAQDFGCALDVAKGGKCQASKRRVK